MYSKKHIAIAVVITYLITSVLAGVGYWLKEELEGVDILVAARQIIEENYVDELSDEQVTDMYDAALYAMVASLKDPYSYYFNMEDYDEFEENAKEEYVGIGISVIYDKEAKKLTVTAPTSGSPADKAGILPQDIILGIDELSVEKDGYDAIINYIKNGGKEGDTVKVHIMRKDKKITLDVVRAVITLNTITQKMLDDKIAYIKISEFQHNSVKDFEKALKEIKAIGAKGLIIDLRSNPGGYADSVIKMTDMLLPEGTIAYLEDNKGNKQYFNSDKSCIDIPMAVLVNEGTASAAELMAGSLKAYEKAKIVGMKTFGKAVGQAPYMLTNETAIYLTSARYYTPKGECIDKKGITPNIEIDLPEELKKQLSTLEPQKDNQLKTAIEALYKEIK